MTEAGRAIPNAVPHLAGNEWKYLKECLDTNWVSSVGPFVDRFELEVSARVGVPHAVATVNGTAALHVALLAAGVGPDDEVLVPALTFIATANAVTYCGGHPVFLDSEAVSWGLDAYKLSDFLERECSIKDGQVVNRASGRVVRAVLPVHLYGHPVDIDAVLDVAGRYPLAVVEDAAEALGARYKGGAVGCHGLASCLSFNGNKIITTGGGGMVLTRDPKLAARVRALTTQARTDALEYIHEETGYNLSRAAWRRVRRHGGHGGAVGALHVLDDLRAPRSEPLPRCARAPAPAQLQRDRGPPALAPPASAAPLRGDTGLSGRGRREALRAGVVAAVLGGNHRG